jgi:D-3-phosphoglycerate dehydrogenase
MTQHPIGSNNLPKLPIFLFGLERERLYVMKREITKIIHIRKIATPIVLPPVVQAFTMRALSKRMIMRILVADKLADEGLDYLKSTGIDFDAKVGLKEDELASAVGGYDALIVRSGAKVTAKVLENPGNLKAIAARRRRRRQHRSRRRHVKGILVLNTAEASTLSTAEHALALMMALARKIPAGARAREIGQWKRNHIRERSWPENAGRRRLRSHRPNRRHARLAMDMKVLGFDPFFSGESALDGKVKLLRDFDEFLRRIDVITFHVPGGESTRHLLNRERLFNKCKPNLLVVNDARGEVLDEVALADALKEKKIAGAAIDVYATEPPRKIIRCSPGKCGVNAAPRRQH